MQLISDKTLQGIESALGLDLLEEKEKTEMMNKIIALISSRAGIRIIKGFSEEETREFNQIPERNLEEMENYILSKNDHAHEIFEEEARNIQEEILKTKI